MMGAQAASAASGMRERDTAMRISRTETKCRSCGGAELAPILSFGRTPLADRLLLASDLAAPDVTAPLDLVLCRACSLVQISETVAPEVLFGGDYPYFSSVSSTLLEHSRANALEPCLEIRVFVETKAGCLGGEVPTVEGDIDDRILGAEEVAPSRQQVIDQSIDDFSLLLVPTNPVRNRLGREDREVHSLPKHGALKRGLKEQELDSP